MHGKTATRNDRCAPPGADRGLSVRSTQPTTASHNAADFSDFYRDNYRAALRYVLYRTTTCDTEALVADAFLLAWQHLLAHGEINRAWLFCVLRNKIGDHYRAAARDATHTDRIQQLHPEEPGADPSSASDVRLDVHRVLNELKPHESEALALSFWADLSTREAAKVVGISHVAYRVRLTRAKKKFMAAYSPQVALQEGAVHGSR